MTSPILVPLDGSGFAEQALPTALDIADRTGGRVHLVLVHVPDGGMEPERLRLIPSHEQAAEYLRSVADRCRLEAGQVVRTEVLQGAIATELTTYAQSHEVGLVVMTSHGQGGISRAWLGSVADALVRRMRVPVLLLRPTVGAVLDPPLARPRHLLVPVDGSALSARVLGPAASLGALWAARLTLLHVLPSADEHTAPLFEGCTEDPVACAELVLDELAAPLRRDGRTVDIAVVTCDSPAKAILDFACTHAVDAIAMATRGHGGWERVAVGSVADKVMRGALLPLVLYRPPAAGPADLVASRAALQPAALLMAG